MKRKVYKLLFIFVILFGLVGCDKKEFENYKLKIVESSWSGWTKDYKPEEITTMHDIVLDKEYVISKGDLGLTFTIVKIEKDSIVIETTRSFSDYEKGVDLTTKKKEFVIEKDKILELTTPTMDTGNIYYLSLVKK